MREEFGFAGDDSAVAKCFLLWAGLVGAISLEVFGQYGADTLTEPGAVFDTQVRLLIDDADRLAGAHGAMVPDARTILVCRGTDEPRRTLRLDRGCTPRS